MAPLFEFEDGKYGVYHEPHGDHEWTQLMKYKNRINVVITPVVKAFIELPLFKKELYTIVNGVDKAIQLCKTISPDVCVGFNNSSGDASGFLYNVMGSDGGVEKFIEAVSQNKDLNKLKLVTGFDAMQEIVIAGCDDEDNK